MLFCQCHHLQPGQAEDRERERVILVILAQILFIPAKCCKHKTELPMKQLPVLGTSLLSPSIRL